MTVDTAPPPSVTQVNALRPFQGLWNGLTFGEGTQYIVPGEITDLFSYSARLGDSEIPQGDGDFSFSRYAASRFVQVPFLVTGTPLTSTLEDQVNTWLRTFDAVDVYGQGWLVWRGVDRAWMWRCRVSRRRVKVSPEQMVQGAIEAVAEFKLADPRVYDARQRPGGLVPTTAGSGGGFDLPVELPLDMTASTAGTLNANNTGDAIAWPVLQVSNGTGSGNITEVEVTNATTGEVFHIITDIAEGQVLVADFDRLVRRAPGPHVHIDEASRYGDWQHPRVPLGIQPGSNLFTSQVTGGAPTVRLDWYNTSL